MQVQKVHRRERTTVIALAAIAILALAPGPFAAVARAVGDPAAGVLATQPLFLPQDAGVPARLQLQLVALLQAAGRSGVQLRVARVAGVASFRAQPPQLWRSRATAE